MKNRIRGLESKLREWEEREAAICPEDYSFEEYIRSLQAQIKHLNGLFPDDPKVQGELESKIVRLKECVKFQEWTQELGCDDDTRYCKACGAYEVDGHKDDCWIDAELREGE